MGRRRRPCPRRLPLAASAQQAFARGPVNLRAGPGGQLSAGGHARRRGSRLRGDGLHQPATAGATWCCRTACAAGSMRRSLDYAYQERRVPLATYGAVIGVPSVTFAIGSYWSNYYRDRPWYDQPRWWGGRPPPPPAPAGAPRRRRCRAGVRIRGRAMRRIRRASVRRRRRASVPPSPPGSGRRHARLAPAARCASTARLPDRRPAAGGRAAG